MIQYSPLASRLLQYAYILRIYAYLYIHIPIFCAFAPICLFICLYICVYKHIYSYAYILCIYAYLSIQMLILCIFIPIYLFICLYLYLYLYIEFLDSTGLYYFMFVHNSFEELYYPENMIHIMYA